MIQSLFRPENTSNGKIEAFKGMLFSISTEIEVQKFRYLHTFIWASRTIFSRGLCWIFPGSGKKTFFNGGNSGEILFYHLTGNKEKHIFLLKR